MLSHLSIRDFAIVRHLELNFESGMTVLTGETGAGKSILVDAVALVLGGRAHSDAVRGGGTRTEILAVFTLTAQTTAQQWLEEQELDMDDAQGECILRRTVSKDGRSRAYINGRPVPVQTLREFGERLVDVYGQHAHQSMLRREAQRQRLDAFGRHDALLGALAALHGRWRDIQQRIETESGTAEEHEARLDYLRYQARELEQLALTAAEFTELGDEQRRLAHAGDLIESCERTITALADDHPGAALATLQSSLSTLEEVAAFDRRIPEIRKFIDTAAIEISEAVSLLRACTREFDNDPARLQEIDARLSSIHDVARKHRVQPHELPRYLERLHDEIAAIEGSEIRLRQLEQELTEVGDEHAALCTTLHARRVEAAQALAEAVTENMQVLGMQGGRFEIEVEHARPERPSPNGSDRVDFLVTTNSGQPPRALNRVASGGELSRLSLAIQVSGTDTSTVPTLIFDEVDVGIGGKVAEIVGRRLHTLGVDRQVLCVTHLPQVASQAHHHVQIHKSSALSDTRVELAPLGGEERIMEIARMLGGAEITARTLAHAREMLERA